MSSPLDPLLQSLQSFAARDRHALTAFRVGELDIYAATSAEQALALAAQRDGENRHTAGDVRPVSAELLDRPVVVDGRVESLRGWLRVTAVPGWLARGVWVEVDLAAAPLAAFWVGDMDIYAARSAADALVQCLGHSAMPAAYELDDVTAVTEAELAMTLIGEDGRPDGTLAELLATATEPGWLMGTE